MAVAPLAHGGDMQLNPSDDGINFNPSGRNAPDHTYTHNNNNRCITFIEN